MAGIDWFDRHLARRSDEVVDQIDHISWALDVRKVADAREHLKPASRSRSLCSVGVVERNDLVFVAPDGHGRQLRRQMQPIQRADRLPAVVHY
jgi:hypothetical protein